MENQFPDCFVPRNGTVETWCTASLLRHEIIEFQIVPKLPRFRNFRQRIMYKRL